MKILWLSHLVPYPPKAGVLQRSYNLLKESAKYHEVDLLSFVQEDFFNQIYSNPQDGISEANEHLASFCKRVKFVPINNYQSSTDKYALALKSLFTKDPYTINWLKSQQYSNALQQWVNESDYDLVHFDTISLVPYLQQIKNTASTLNHHNIESHLLLRRAKIETNLLKKIYYKQEGKRLEQYEKKYCRRFSVNITCSDMDSERLHTIDSQLETKAIPNGVDLDYFSPDERQDNSISITFIGTLNWEPNKKAVIFIAEKIWPIIKKEIPDIVCHIIGTHPPEETVALSKKDTNFKVHGFVDDVRDHLHQGTIIVCPIKDGGGTKLKLLDAFAMKAAVIADPIACEGIEVTNNKDVLFAETPEQYAKKIADVINDKDKRKTLGDNGRSLVEAKYSYHSIGRILSDLFTHIRH